MLGLLRRVTRDQFGGPAIEFAIAGPIVLLALIGCIEFGRVFWIRNTLEYALEEAARYAILNKNATDTDIQTQVRNNVMGVDPSIVTVSVVPTAGSNVTYKAITATVSTNSGKISLITDFLPVKMLPLTAQTRVVVPN